MSDFADKLMELRDSERALRRKLDVMARGINIRRSAGERTENILAAIDARNLVSDEYVGVLAEIHWHKVDARRRRRTQRGKL